MSTVESSWFECVTLPTCRADVVRSFTKVIRQYIPVLLETFVNLKDKNVSKLLESFARTREIKCNNQGVIKGNTTKENPKKLRIIKCNTLECISRVFANHSKYVHLSIYSLMVTCVVYSATINIYF